MPTLTATLRRLTALLTHSYTLRALNILFFFVMIGAYYFARWYLADICAIKGCGMEITSGWIKPLLIATPTLALTFAFLLLFPARVFGWWLVGIFWWYATLALIWITSIPPHGYDFETRTGVAEGTAELLFMLTAFFTGIALGILWKKRHLSKTRALLTFALWAPGGIYAAMVFWRYFGAF